MFRDFAIESPRLLRFVPGIWALAWLGLAIFVRIQGEAMFKFFAVTGVPIPAQTDYALLASSAVCSRGGQLAVGGVLVLGALVWLEAPRSPVMALSFAVATLEIAILGVAFKLAMFLPARTEFLGVGWVTAATNAVILVAVLLGSLVVLAFLYFSGRLLLASRSRLSCELRRAVIVASVPTLAIALLQPFFAPEVLAVGSSLALAPEGIRIVVTTFGVSALAIFGFRVAPGRHVSPDGDR